MTTRPSIAFIGGGNMAAALAAGLIGTQYDAHDVHVIDINAATLRSWSDQGCSVAPEPDATLAARRVWIFAVKPQYLQAAVAACKPFLQPDTLVVSVAAGIAAQTLAGWLGQGGRPWTRLVRCMPNTPALVGAGVTGMLALDGVDAHDRALADQLLGAVGQIVRVDSDAALDAVTALSGSGPAYVFLFLQALIEGGCGLGLSAEQARTLALATVAGATQLAAASSDDLAVLREQVTSRGGTTAAALDVLQQGDFAGLVASAMRAAAHRAGELSAEFSDTAAGAS